MYYFAKKYKRYDMGTASLAGADPYSATAQAITGVMRTSGQILDGFTPADEFGNKPMVTDLASTYLKNAGNIMAGPMMVAEYFKNKQNQKLADQARFREKMFTQNAQRNQSQAILGANPELAHGVTGAGYFAKGGPLSMNFLKRGMCADGGSLTPMSDDAVAVNGPDHEQGGVGLPDVNAEVEGGETMQDNFVFSKRLGFAQEHKRLQNAIGKIQDKGVMTPERVNAVKRMKQRSENLKLSQEYFKHVLGHFGQPVDQP